MVMRDLESPDALDLMAHAAALGGNGVDVDALVVSGELYDRRGGALPVRIISGRPIEQMLAEAGPYRALIGEAVDNVPGRSIRLALGGAPAADGRLALAAGVDLDAAAAARPFAPRGLLPRLLVQADAEVEPAALAGLIAALKTALPVEVWAIGRAARADQPGCGADLTLPYVQAHQAVDIYAACDGLLPLGQAAHSLSTLLLAMACGCVPLLAAADGPHDSLAEAVDHLVYHRATPPRLRHVVRAAIRDRDRLLEGGCATASLHAWRDQAEPLQRALQAMKRCRRVAVAPETMTSAGGWRIQSPQPSAALVAGRRLFGWLGRVGGGDLLAASLHVGAWKTAVGANDPRPAVAAAMGAEGVYGFRASAPWPQGEVAELAYVASEGDCERRLPLGDGSAARYADDHAIVCLDETLLQLDPAADPSVRSLSVDLKPDSLVELDGVLHRASRLACAPGQTIACRAQDILMVVTEHVAPG